MTDAPGTLKTEADEFVAWGHAFANAIDQYEDEERDALAQALRDACEELSTDDARRAMSEHLRDSRAAYLFGEVADEIRTNPALYAARLRVREEWTPDELLQLAQELLAVVRGCVASPPPPPPLPADDERKLGEGG